MKKTLAALIIGAFAASAANAAVVYNNEGTKVEVKGSLRLILEKTNKGGESAEHSHSGLRNAGTRVEVNVKHDLSDGFYALGHVQLRFDGKQGNGSKADGFGAVGTRRAYVGLGKQELGQLTFGRQLTIADELGTAKDYDYGITNKGKYMPTESNSVIRYTYNGVENLTVSANYIFADERDDKNEVKNAEVQNGFQVGAVYEDGIIAKLGFGRTNFNSDNRIGDKKSYKDAILASFGYDFGVAKVFVDAGYQKYKNQTISIAQPLAAAVYHAADSKAFYIAPGFVVPVSEQSSVYGNYKYEYQKITAASPLAVAGNVSINKLSAKQHGILLGVDYKLHKQVITFVEGKYQETQAYANGIKVGDKVKDKAIGVGMRVLF